MSASIRRMTLAGCCALGLLLMGCAQPGAMTSASNMHSDGQQVPLLRLPPNTLGKAIAEQQRLTVLAPNRTPQTLEVLLEADPQSVRLALMQLGQVAAQLVWDGVDLHVTRSRWWPSDVSAERILSDMQLTYWPLQAIQAALPADWNMVDAGPIRVLRHGATAEITIQTISPSVREVMYRAGWRLRIESISLESRADNPSHEVTP